MAWYLMQTRPHQETLAATNLLRQGYGCYQPIHQVEKLIAGKLCMKDEALFPGYLFVEIAAQQSWCTIRSTYGVRSLVCFGGKALPVSELLISQLRARCETEQAQCRFTKGQSVEVKKGPFAGLNAVFQCKKAEDRVIVLIRLLQSVQAIELPVAALV
ncbi:Transcriptional activator RfaH [gamma proteobacterium HdN1]|nr:Transcriptional activator RfaH [gamma proteobacterium HdN1]